MKYLLIPELPPRARRIRARRGDKPSRLGTTSACAENTRFGVWVPPVAGNYLRVRGEYTQRVRGVGAPLELPPRARRIPGNSGMTLDSIGTTSACAENTLNELGLL